MAGHEGVVSGNRIQLVSKVRHPPVCRRRENRRRDHPDDGPAHQMTLGFLGAWIVRVIRYDAGAARVDDHLGIWGEVRQPMRAAIGRRPIAISRKFESDGAIVCLFGMRITGLVEHMIRSLRAGAFRPREQRPVVFCRDIPPREMIPRGGIGHDDALRRKGRK